MFEKKRTTIIEGENNLVAEEDIGWADNYVPGQTVTLKGRRYKIRVISPQDGNVVVVVDNAP